MCVCKGQFNSLSNVDLVVAVVRSSNKLILHLETGVFFLRKAYERQISDPEIAFNRTVVGYCSFQRFIRTKLNKDSFLY